LILCIADVLAADDLRSCAETLAAARFVDGRTTAGWHARLVKRNLQAERGGDGPEAAALDTLRARLEARLLEHRLFRLAARPKALTPLILSRYEPGMAYGTHVDDALIGGAGVGLHRRTTRRGGQFPR